LVWEMVLIMDTYELYPVIEQGIRVMFQYGIVFFLMSWYMFWRLNKDFDSKYDSKVTIAVAIGSVPFVSAIAGVYLLINRLFFAE
jgi:hypothetical protein